MFPCVPDSMVFSSSDRWEVGIGLSETGQFEQVSFVNSVNTVRGGTHIADIIEPLSRLIAEKIARKNASGVSILPAHIRNHLFVFVRCLVQNPSFDSQTKETLITRPANFGSRFKLTDALVQQLLDTTQLQDRVLAWALFRKTQELNSGTAHFSLLSLIYFKHHFLSLLFVMLTINIFLFGCFFASYLYPPSSFFFCIFNRPWKIPRAGFYDLWYSQT